MNAIVGAVIAQFINHKKAKSITNVTTVAGAGIGTGAYLTLLQSDDIYMQACGVLGIILGITISLIKADD